MDNALVPMLNRLVDKVSRMKPIPPCDDLRDATWEKVDKLVLKMLNAMKEKGVARPLHPLSETLLEMALKDVAEKFPDTTQALQTVAYRVMDTRLIVDEFGRMRNMALLIRDASQGKEVEFPSYDFPPESPVFIPPSFTKEVYNDGAAYVVESFAYELRNRGILKQKEQD